MNRKQRREQQKGTGSHLLVVNTLEALRPVFASIGEDADAYGVEAGRRYLRSEDYKSGFGYAYVERVGNSKGEIRVGVLGHPIEGGVEITLDLPDVIEAIRAENES